EPFHHVVPAVLRRDTQCVPACEAVTSRQPAVEPVADMNFYAWLAAQPAWVEVAIGVAFVMFVGAWARGAVAYGLVHSERLCRLPSDVRSAVPPLHDLCGRLLVVINEGPNAKLRASHPLANENSEHGYDRCSGIGRQPATGVLHPQAHAGARQPGTFVT